MTTQAGVETGLVSCPHPGCSMGDAGIHPVGVEVNSGGVITDVDHGGTRITRGKADGRGVTIVIRFVCEEGHEFRVRFHFHKGSTGFEIIPTGDPEAYAFEPTIWRD